MFDAVHRHFIDALERRLPNLKGEARVLLERRVAQWRSAHHDAPPHATRTTERKASPFGPDGPLRDLVQQLDGSLHATGPTARSAHVAHGDAPKDLKTVHQFRDSWLALSAQRQLALSLSATPVNAGPLHSQRLLHRALSSMHALSPTYLHHLLSYAQALHRLEAATGGSVSEVRVKRPPGQPSRPAARRRR
jgi:hypothetical protein